MRSKAKKGFTLIEAVAALFIAGLTVTAVSTLLITVLKQDRLASVMRRGRVLLDEARTSYFTGASIEDFIESRGEEAELISSRTPCNAWPGGREWINLSIRPDPSVAWQCRVSFIE